MDFLTVQWSKLDSLPEFFMLIAGVCAVGLAIWYVFNKKKTDAVEKLDERTIKSYQENNKALEDRLKIVEAETKTCHEQHGESLKLIHGLQGELKAYKDLALIPKDFIKEIQRNQLEIIKLLKTNTGNTTNIKNEVQK